MRWVTALDLERWAETICSRTDLSELINDLVRATAQSIGDIRFPSGDSAQIPGYDGRLTAVGVPPYIPDGTSVWEFSTEYNYLSKANSDYSTRSSDPGPVDPANTTFVFVTPRRWQRTDTSREKWIADHQGENRWRDISVIDAIALEEWLSLAAAVAARWAPRLGLMPVLGVQDTDEFWKEYAARFDPVLTETVLLAGRDQQAEDLVRQLLEKPFRHMWQADSPEEVIAFSVAAIRSTEPNARKYLEARTVIVSTEDAARQLAVRSGLVFLPRASALRVASYLGQRNATVIPLGRDAPAREDATLLNRPTSDQLVQALKTMGRSDDWALQIGRTCGRSVTILARRIASGSAPKPEWDGQTTLIPALLAGGWDAQSDDDQKIVAAVAGKANYLEYEDQLRAYLRMQDPPLEREGSVWKIRAPIDAFVHLAPLIGARDVDRLRAATLAVFSERDPRLELPPDERPYAGLQGQRLRHSEWLRTGIATTLQLVSVLHEQVGFNVSGIDPRRFVEQLVADLPGLDKDYRAIASLHGQLSLLMEAAPRPLVSALERLLEGDVSASRGIFQDQGESMFGTHSPHTAILWALEMLAWDPAYLSDACSILARLARIDPGGKLSNRPINSLREILLPWHPNTHAVLAQRLQVLDQIVKQEPNVGWELLLKLMPESHSVGTNTSKPRYREVGASESEVLTVGHVRRTYSEVIKRALRAVGEDPGRWVSIIKGFSSFGPDERGETMELLESISDRIRGKDRFLIWTALRNEVNRHTAFPDAAWAMRGPDLDRLKRIADQWEPSDSAEKIVWLFDDYHPHLPGGVGFALPDAVEKARREAIASLIETEGDFSILRLAARVKYPHLVALSAVVVINDAQRVEQLVDEGLQKLGLGDFVTSISAQGKYVLGDLWCEVVARRYREGTWTRELVSKLLLGWPDDKASWRFISSLDETVEKEYWTNKPAWFTHGNPEDLNFAAKKYLEVGRPLAVIRSMHTNAPSLDSEVLLRVLDEAIVEINSFPTRATANLTYELDDLFEALRNKQDVPPLEIAKREYAYLPLFGYAEKSLTLHKLLAEDAELYVSVLCDVFKSETQKEEEPTEERKARARAGYRLLSEFHTLPGMTDRGVDSTVLNSWIDRVQALAKEQGRSSIADEFVGHLLAHSTSGPDGVWPDVTIAQLVEQIASKRVEEGIEIERFNMRGTSSRAMFEGGGQERALAETVRRSANARKDFPRTYRMLIRIADAWERYAEHEDKSARQDAMRFE